MNPNTPEQRTPRRRCKPQETVGQPDLPNWSTNIPRDFTRQTPIMTRDGERKNPPGSRTHMNPYPSSSTFILQEAPPKKGAAESPTTSTDIPLQHPPTALRSNKSTSGQQETAGKIPEKEATRSGSRTLSPSRGFRPHRPIANTRESEDEVGEGREYLIPPWRRRLDLTTAAWRTTPNIGT
jgi:hypothetical protein